MKCSYCSKDIEPGTGIMYVRKNGTIRYYCSSRCFKLDNVLKRKIRVKNAGKAKAQEAVASQQATAAAASKQ